MSDFPWADKSSEKWYVIYPHGHEGPYSLNFLEDKVNEKVFSLSTKVWSEGLISEMTLEAVLSLAHPPPKTPRAPESPAKSPSKIPKEKTSPTAEAVEEELPPPLPPLPIEEEEVPPPPIKEEKLDIPSEDFSETERPEAGHETSLPKKSKLSGLILVLLVISLGVGAIHYLKEEKKKMTITRPQGMSLKVSEKVSDYLEFKSFKEPLFFKEFVSEDYSSIWLASSSFHRCQVKAHFKSQKDKLLSLEEEEIEFTAQGALEDHLVNFKKIDFQNGRKVIPGMYEMNLSATDCVWNGVIVQLMNLFKKPEPHYSSKMTVILYPQGADEFKDLLDKILRRRLEKSIQEQNQVELFWQGVQEKLQTLLAITLQIEQHMLDFIEKDARKFSSNLPQMVKVYMDKYGKFLTNFVVANEESFKDVNPSNIKGVSIRRNYELEISESARKIGFSSMEIIEDLQKLKAPKRAQLIVYENQIKEAFSDLKKDINKKIIQVSDDRSLSPDEDPSEDSPSQK